VESNINMKNKVDISSTHSDRPGIKGWFESLFRQFRGTVVSVLMLPILFLYIFCLGVALTPAVWLVHTVHIFAGSWVPVAYYLALGLSLGAAFFCFGVTLIFVVPLVNWALRINPKPWRGSAHSLEVIPWFYHNALTHLVRYSFLEFVTPTPLNVLFYRMMGMRIGKGVHIATTKISDPCLITLGDYVHLGGSSHIIGHYANKGFLVLAPVVIKKGSMIGLKASVMGDVVVGERALIKAHTVLMPKTRVADDAVV